MKIRKTAKKFAPPSTEAATLISSILSSSEDDLPALLATVPEWVWPRGDLHWWTKVLNKFDALLEKVIAEYDIASLQVNEFTPRTKSLVMEILRFERMLLEHCTNRKIYASYDRLGELLFTQDLDVLEYTIQLLFRPAQQYSSPGHVSELGQNSLIVKRLLSLSQGWGPTREAGYSLSKLASGLEDDLEFPPELGEVQFQFYRRPGHGERSTGAKKEGSKDALVAAEVDVPATPTPAPPTASTSSSSAPPPTFPQLAKTIASTSSASTSNSFSTPVKPKPKAVSDLKEGFKTPAPASTPSKDGPSSSTHDGLTSLNLGNVAKLSSTKSAMGVLADAVEEYQVPKEERFELLNKIRLAMGMGKKETRRKLLVIRCMAIATYSHLTLEPVAQTDLFLYEPELVSHIAELIHPEAGIPYSIMTAAIAALDAVSRYRHRIAEVISSINASANHGVIMSLFRATVLKLAEDGPEPPFEFVEALISFLQYLITTAAYSNMLIGAGIVPMLVQIMQNQLPSRLPIIVKAIGLLDHIVYSNPNGFTIFCNAGGLTALTDRMQSTVDQSVDEDGSKMSTDAPADEDNTYGRLPFPRFSALRALLRSISRMMSTSGTGDGLRNLIDSSLPKTVKKIIENRKAFGATILALAINIMATFVHNEPTSLTVLQEQKLPEAFYDAIEEDIEPNGDIYFAIPNAMGALCLNQAGLDQLTSRPNIIPKIVAVLTSERHHKALQEKENATQLGAYIDELVRHHPILREPLLKAVIDTLNELKTLGSAERSDDETVYHILPAALPSTVAPAESSSSSMEVSSSSASTSAPVDSEPSTSTAPSSITVAPAPVPPPLQSARSQDAEQPDGYVDNDVVLKIGRLARFLEGVFHNQGHAKEFIQANGLVLLLDLYALPCIPYDFAGSDTADSLCALFQAISDINPNAVLSALLKPVRTSLDETKEFWSTMGPSSKLSGMTNLSPGSELDAATFFFRRLVALHGRVALLADMYRGIGFAHAKVATGFLQILNTPEETAILEDLGKLHRACVWENILIKSALPQAVVAIDGGTTGGGPSVARGQMQTVAGVPDDILEDINNGLPDPTKNGDGPAAGDSVQTRNGKAFKYLVSQLPASLTPFSQAILKFFIFKRGSDAAHRTEAHKTANTLAKSAHEHLLWGKDPIEGVSPLSLHLYGTVMVGYTTALLFDNRPSASGSLQTFMLSSFERVGGVEALVDTASRFGKAFSDLDSSDHPLQLDHVHIFSGLKVTLSLLQSLVSAKALFESPQTASITTKDRNATSDEDFDPYRFLVKLRLAIFPFIRECWTSSWLESASVSVIRSVIQTLLRIMDADSEEKPESVPAASLAGLPAPLQRPPPPPERIQQLVDMGFTASAATQALVRCHNNASLATEFLLSHPGAFDAPAAPAEEPAQPDAAPAQASTSVEASNSADAEMADASSGEESITKGKEKETEVQKTAPRWDEDRRSELSSWRDELRPDLPKRALALADRYEELVAEIKSAFLRSKDATKLLIDETVPLKADAFTESSAKMSVRLRLLSAVVREDSAAFRDDKELVEKTMSLIVDLLPSSSTKENSSNRPMWLPFQLLVAEGLFIMSEDIVEVAVDESVSESTDTPSLFTGPVFTHARQTFFARCLEILREDGLNREELSAALQILVLLTRDHALAVEFAKRDGVAAAMKVFKESDKKSTSGCQYYIAPILRHIVEEPQALLALMQREIKHWFSVPRSKVVDVAHFVKNTKQIALRNPSLFVQAVSNECALVQHQSQTGNYHIKLKPTEENAGEKEAKEKGENVTTELPKVPVESGSEMQVDEPTLSEPSPASGPDSEVLESMVHQLLGELLLSGKQAVSLISGSTVDSSNETPSDDTTSQTASTADASSSSVPSAPIPASSTAAETPASTTIPATAAAPAGLGDFVYSSLLMQNLTELLGSYMSCKTAFLTMGRRRAGKDSLVNSSKPRTATLNFLIQDLVCCTSLAEQASPSKAETKKLLNLANCAMTVIVALCSDVSSTPDIKDINLDLITVRKVVLEAISKAIKDATSSSDHIDLRYGRLHSLSELCYRLLTARPSIQPKGTDDGTLHIAKVMLEKNFAVVLTNALADIDLNYPDVKLVVTDILKPLEHLTKISIKMGKADKKKDAANAHVSMDDEFSSDSAMDEDDESESEHSHHEENEEDTPDLYRNSALGMYGGEMEEGYDDSDGDGDEDMDGYDEDDMSEGPTDSGTEDSNSTGESALEDELLAGEDDWEDEDDEEGGGSGDDEQEMMFDPDGEEVHPNELDDEMEPEDMDEIDEMDEEGLPIMDDEDDERDEMTEGEEDFEQELIDQLEADPDIAPPTNDSRLTNWGWTSAGQGSADPFAPASGRRRAAYQELAGPGGGPQDPFQPFGFPAPAVQPGDAAAGAPAGLAEIIQTIENLVGNGGGAAVRLLEQLVAQGRNTDTIQIGLAGPGGGPEGSLGGITINRDGTVAGHGRLAGIGGTTGRPPAHEQQANRSSDPFSLGNDFTPLPTPQRWHEEERLTQGRNVNTRLARLTNHLVNRLIPAARSAHQKAKEEIEAAEKKQKEKEEELDKLKASQEKTKKELEELKVQKAAEDAANQPVVEEVAHAAESSTSAEDSSSAPAAPAAAVDLGEDVEMGAPSAEQTTPPEESATTASAESSSSTEAQTSSSTGEGAAAAESLDQSASATASEEAPQASGSGEAEARPSSAPERITISIHGEEVDITDTGIDITFLEALPDDMREEVLNQHFRERRPASRPAAAAPTEINDDFLNALPPDIRAEVLQQEAIETSRRAREAAARAQREGDQAAGAPAVQPADIDPASFLASLDPELRNDVMMEQDDEFLQSLPGGLLAGLGGGYRSAPEGGSILAGLQPPSGGARRSENRGSRGVTGASGSGGEAAVPAKKPVARDAIQLLDKTGIASLVRLLFFPEVSRKSIVPRVLVNLCENSKTRAELLNLLLTVVQDGTGDLSAVDKSFAQMNIRGGKTNTPKTATPKKKAPDTPGPAALFSHLSAESIPTFIAQRCFDALSQIVQSIDRASFFFLTEHDVLVGLKRAAAKKGKGKERQILQTKYPLVVLLGLLDRPALLKNSSMMDSLTALLVLITKPLTTLPPPPPSDGPKDTSLMGILGIPPTSISSSTAAPPPTPSPATAAENALSADQATSSEEQPEAKATVEDSSTVLSRPPQVPNNVLRLVVNILTHGECSSATFKSALTLIHHLSFIPDAKEIITAELRSQAQEFGNALQVDLQELSGALKQAEETTRAVTIAKFTPASSTQAKLLRCLKADEFIFKPASADASRSGVAAASAASPPVAVSPGVEGASSIDPVATVTPEEDLAHSVFSSFSFGPLWSSLSECLAIVEENDSLSDVATVLLPVVESLMVVSRYTLSKAARSTAAAAAQGSLSPKSPSSSEQPSSAISTLSDDIFVKFTDNHRKILNTIIRANPALMSGSFALLVENPRVLDFTNKRAYFAQQLRRRPNKEAPHTLQVNVRRQQIFEDSFSKFMRWTPEQIKYGKLNCRFWDEPGIDAGGVSREWFSELAKSIFNADYGLFEPSSSGSTSFQINRVSSVNPNHLAFFRFVGVIVAKAIQDGRLLDAHFVRSIYRQLLGAKNMSLQDLESVDPSYHTSLRWMQDNSIDDVLELTFSVESDAFGEKQIHDLIPDGRNIEVNDSNKLDYIQRIVNFRLTESVQEQSDALIAGVHSIIPLSLLQIYDAGELELLISGLPTIDIDELKNSVQYHGWRNSDPEITWLWRALRSFSQAERAAFMQFVTSSARVPLGGFSQLVGSNGIQPVQIHRAHGEPDRIPTSHTCYNQIDVGSYSSYETLRAKLLYAITEGATGFGFA